jgi:putative DNA primase/helicase
VTTNPYAPGTSQYETWYAGWLAANPVANPFNHGTAEHAAWEAADQAAPYPHDDDDASLSGDPLPDEPLTELGYAMRLVAVYGHRLRHVSAWHRWLAWDGRRWREDTTGQAVRWAKSIARRVTMSITTQPADSHDERAQRKSDLRMALRAESSSAIQGALLLASTDEGIAVSPDDLDADPHLLTVTNGTVDLRTGELCPHRPGDLITRLAPAAYRPDCDSALWHKFLERVQPDEQVRGYLARLMGHALQGSVVEHVLPIMWGDGANGKGTFITAIHEALGDYADAADPSLLAARSFDVHPTGVADLYGLRLAFLHESDEGRQLAEGTVKRLTGGDRLKARRMREDFWSFQPTHTFVMLTNHRPVITGTDEGIWRRLRIIPWPVVIPPDERDDQLGEQLAAERDAVLSWLVDGHLAWRSGGLDDPEQVRVATRAYRVSSDVVGRFLEDRCHTSPAASVQSAPLFAAWTRWCQDEGEPPGSNKAFSEAMHKRGFRSTKSHGRMVWDGVGLAATEDEP